MTPTLTPPVQHPDDPARWGVFVPLVEYVSRHGSCDGYASKQYPQPKDEWDGESWVREFLEAHEFDWHRPHEGIWLGDGFGVFYLPEPR